MGSLSVSPRTGNLNLHLIMELMFEHSPGWIIDGSRRKLILYAIETKDLEFLRILTPTVDPFINTSEYIEFAASIENNIPIIEYLVLLNCPMDQLKVLISAVEKKALKNLKFFHEKMEFPIDDNYRVFSSAASIENNIEMMEYLVSHNCPISNLATSKSAAENNLKWLLKNGFSMEDCDISNNAIWNGLLKVFKWLKRNKCSIKYPEIFVAAVHYGSLDIMKWLLDNGCPIGDLNIMRAAAKYGSLDIMKWLLENGCPKNDPLIVDDAIKHGSLRNLKWLLENQYPVNEDTKTTAKQIFG